MFLVQLTFSDPIAEVQDFKQYEVYVSDMIANQILFVA